LAEKIHDNNGPNPDLNTLAQFLILCLLLLRNKEFDCREEERADYGAGATVDENEEQSCKVVFECKQE
jgi:hypothetical protein